ncbi:DUF4179 domain-containing protein [Haloimpatiens sp. FM7315]|uniref:DUF4179 domain-containing protein n=1 Tax=Haloimpatiens sp. FM7315 TaxID=3298609 RepID=UPI0035A2B955
MNKNFDIKEKDIFKLLNDVKIEEGEFNDMDEEINEFQKEKIKKDLNKKIKENNHFKKIKYGSIAAGLALVCTIGVSKASPAFAKNIPILNSIIKTLNLRHDDEGEYEKYAQMVNKSVTSNGVTLTLNEVIADDSSLIIGYTVKSPKKINDSEVLHLLHSTKINGKSFGSTGTADGRFIDDNTYIGSEEMDLTLPKGDKFNVDLDFTHIGSVKGNWNFAFTASRDEMCKISKTFTPNMKVEFPDSLVNIDKVVFSPVNTTISLRGDYKDKSKNPNPSSLFKYDYWVVFDEKGVELQPKSIGGGSSNEKHFNSKMSFVSQKNTPKYLTVVPCCITPSGAGGVSVDENGNETQLSSKTQEPKEVGRVIDGKYPIVLPQGKMGKLTINEIKTEKGKTVVNFTAKGKAPYFQAEDLFIKDEKGDIIDIKDYIKRDEKNPNKFTKAFEKLDPNKKYTIFTNDFSNIEFRDDLKFNIELNK